MSKDIKGVRSRHGAIASSTQLQHLHEEVSRVQVRAAAHGPTLWWPALLTVVPQSNNHPWRT